MIGDNKDIIYFAETDSRNRRVPFGIKLEDRSRHTYIIGKTGMGKSTVLENMAIQDVLNGNGLAFLDPHGKTADLFLQYIPEERMKDVIYFAPFDTEHPISFNVMEDVGSDKRHLVVNGLMSAFKKIWVDAWSARMEYILNNTLLALLEYPGSTLIGVNRMFSDKEYRKEVVSKVTDTSVKAFWNDEFAKYNDKYAQEATAAIQNKIGQFISNPMVRNIIGQPNSTFDLREVMDKKKIVLINLSKGRMGEANANLLGSMIITKIYLAAMSRADASEKVLEGLPSFNLYVDEFQNFANESFADILSEARKYKLSLTVAHQYIEQMSEEVRAAVFGNVGTMITFRVGAYDAEVLEKEFAPQFTAEDLVNLGRYQIYLKLMIDGVSSSPFSAATLPQIDRPIVSHADEIVEHSRSVYARPRHVVEEEIQIWHAPLSSANQPTLPSPGKTATLPSKNPQASLPVVKLTNNSQLGPQQPTVIKSPVHNATAMPVPNGRKIPQDVSDERHSKPSQDRKPMFSRPVSLDSLKKKPDASHPVKNDKVQTPAHVAALKDALSKIVKKDSPPQPKVELTKTEAPQPKIEPEQKKEEVKIEKPREVPEDMLRNMLKVE